ncbi:DUF2085 domain-containing protein [Sporofaciens sp. SGI.106]|uniref:DUF2085 domain-containing protein n=1 Tax=Sporofaciens sp. SGI.106 TaxID=3420568 RepID=UPI002A9BDA1B|nr:DUF2085 domain-containing protein [Lachnoclostridium sp.]
MRWNRNVPAENKVFIVHQFLMKIGSTTGCHQMPERSFFWKGYQFPVCARCTGLAVGYLIGVLLFFRISISIKICICLCFLMFFDWYIQFIGVFASTNTRRFFSGLACGIGYMQLICKVFSIFIK